jgi:hypothetical protein
VRTTAILFLLLFVAGGCPAPPKQQEPPPGPVGQPKPEFDSEFERLVWLLKSANFTRRRAAHKKLFAMGKDITPALEEAAADAASEDHRHQIELLIADLRTRESEKKKKKKILVTLAMEKESFESKTPVEVTIEIKNTENVPLEMTVPLLRMRSVAFRLDWTADLTFVDKGKKQPFFATGTERDPWLKDKSWNPAVRTVKPGESFKETIDITDLCRRPARYTVTATYRWKEEGKFESNAVNFEVKKPPAAKKPEKGNEDN